MMLYLRNDAIGVDGICALCEVPGVKGVKWATPNPLKLAEAKAACDPAIIWVGGLAEVWAPAFYAVGARGFTSGLINIWPERSLAIHAALEAGDFVAANALIRSMKIFEDVRAEELNGTNVTAVKAALQAIGRDCGPTRAPSAWPLTDRQQASMTTFLRNSGLI
jgi:4-hydroxy-tetrahydrodipicolinate synthase